MDEKQILELYQSGEQNQAFNLLVRIYGKPLYWHIRRIVYDHDDANDLLQNTYIKAWNAFDTFRGDSKLYTWLFRIATNEVLNFIRKRKIANLISLSDEGRNIEKQLIADPSFNGNEAVIELYKAIAKLPSRQKVIFSMRYFNEVKFDDIADILEITTGAAKASYHHAYNKVIALLKTNLDLDS